MNVRLAILAVILPLVTPTPTSAGVGTAARAAVVSFQRDTNGVVLFTLATARESERLLPGCDRVEISARHAVSAWRWPWAAEATVTAETFARAIDVVEQSFRSKTPVEFGFMGDDLEEQASDVRQCRYKSKGLAVIKNEDGSQAVISFHKQP